MNTLYEKLARSWLLFKRSILVIRDHPKLLVFPIVTSVLTLGIALFFLAPVAAVLLAPHWVESDSLRAIADSIGLVQFDRGNNANFHVTPLGSAILAGIYLLGHVPGDDGQRGIQQPDHGGAQ